METYIIGAGIGIVVALILTLILHFTVFKNTSMGFLYTFIFIIFAVAGAFLVNYFTPETDASTPTPQEQIGTITETVEENWKNTNGGFTFEEIQTSQNDDECPTYDDQIISLKCTDYGGYVAFSYKNGDTYENVLFYKSSSGLILDGVANTKASYSLYWSGMAKLNTFKWQSKWPCEEPYYYYGSFLWTKYDNIVSVSRQTADFVENYHSILYNRDKAKNRALKEAASLTATNATSYFIKFGEVELIGTADTGYIKINSFYNYLYEQIKGQEYNSSKIIDATNSLCVPIPDSLQSNYPISTDKQAEYNGKEYYGVYNCDIAVNLTFVKVNKTINETSNNTDYINTLKEDDSTKDKITVETLTPNFTFSNVSVNLTNSQNSDLSNVDLATNPVKITFSCSDLNLTKTLTISSKEDLLSTQTVLLQKGYTWTYLISSEALIFENFRGSFTLTDAKTTISFDYYYLENYTIASVGLNAVGTVDTSDIDLATNPVRIILSNDDHTYQFIFNDNSLLTSTISQVVELGTYTYTILSDQLVFASVSGTLNITTTQGTHYFNYALAEDEELSFDITISENGSTSNAIYLYSESTNVTTIRNNLTSSSKKYIVACFIYDDDGKLVEEHSHNHSSTGTCGDTWSLSYLTSGETYTLQLRFSDAEDTSITYLSDIVTFTYTSGTAYKLVYTATENA